MMRGKMSGLKPAVKPLEHGRFVYAYRNVQTNQVVYSLSRSMKNHRVLKQLPDLGANNKPAALRKDHWKPLWTLTLPENEGAIRVGRSQGLELFKALREYRKLHELSWTPPAELSRPRTEKELENIQTMLDKRGGSKKESPHDIIKRQKKRMRVREVMDQKANSIADLAAILLKQSDEKIWRLSEYRKAISREDRVAAMLKASEEAGDGKIEALAQEILELREQDSQEPESISLLQSKEKELEQLEFGTINQLKNEIQELRDQIKAAKEDGTKDATSKTLLWAKKKTLTQLEREQYENSEVRKAKLALALHDKESKTVEEEFSKLLDPETLEARAAPLRKELAEIRLRNKEDNGLSDGFRIREYEAKLELRRFAIAKQADERFEQLRNKALNYWSTWGLEVQKWTAFYLDDKKKVLSEEVKEAIATSVLEHDIQRAQSNYLGKRPKIADLLEPCMAEYKAPTEQIQQRVGPVHINWQNIMDTEYAEAWPTHIRHTAMGTVRHTAPAPADVYRLKKDRIAAEKEQFQELEARDALVNGVKQSVLSKLKLN